MRKSRCKQKKLLGNVLKFQYASSTSFRCLVVCSTSSILNAQSQRRVRLQFTNVLSRGKLGIVRIGDFCNSVSEVVEYMLRINLARKVSDLWRAERKMRNLYAKTWWIS